MTEKIPHSIFRVTDGRSSALRKRRKSHFRSPLRLSNFILRRWRAFLDVTGFSGVTGRFKTSHREPAVPHISCYFPFGHRSHTLRTATPPMLTKGYEEFQ
jgi:hypothetical protein